MGDTVTRTMARGETIMPIPGGEITGSEIWHAREERPEEPLIEEPCECDDGCEGCAKEK